MESFHVEGIYEIQNLGTVYCVKLPERMRHEAVSARYLGKKVELWVMLESEPRVRKVVGVELWAIPELPAGAPMGLLTEAPTGGTDE